MPCALAVSTAILSVPLPRREIRRQFARPLMAAGGSAVGELEGCASDGVGYWPKGPVCPSDQARRPPGRVHGDLIGHPGKAVVDMKQQHWH